MFTSPSSSVSTRKKPGSSIFSFRLVSCGNFKRKKSSRCCFHPPSSSVIFPDLALYSQREELAEGRQPRWVNADIEDPTPNGGRDTEKIIRVTVRNRSDKVRALQAKVTVAYSTFGIGFPFEPISYPQYINLEPQTEASLPFRTPFQIAPPPAGAVQGKTLYSIGVLVLVEHEKDKRQINNVGEHMRKTLPLPIQEFEYVPFPVKNNVDSEREIFFSLTDTHDDYLFLEQESRVFSAMEEVEMKLLHSGKAFIYDPDAELEKEVSIIAKDATGSLVGGLTISFRYVAISVAPGQNNN